MSEQSDNTSTSSTSATSLELGAIKAQLEILSLKIEKNALSSSKEESKKKPWWSTAIEIMGIPTLAVAILFQVSQTTSNWGVPEKTRAETEKLKTEELKTRAELTQLLDGIAKKKTEGIDEYRSELEQTLPKLEATIRKLNDLDVTSKRWAIENIFAVYIALWIVYIAISLFFEIVRQIWSGSLTAINNTVYTLSFYDPDTPIPEKRRKRIRRVQRMMPWINSLLAPLPSIVEWAIRLSIFAALMIPFFDRISAFLGSSEGFGSILSVAKGGNIAGVIAKLKAILFGGF